MSKIKVTKIKSGIGQTKRTRNVLASLGLSKIGSSNTLTDNNCIRGMVNKVKHLVSYELIND